MSGSLTWTDHTENRQFVYRVHGIAMNNEYNNEYILSLTL